MKLEFSLLSSAWLAATKIIRVLQGYVGFTITILRTKSARTW